MALWQAWGHPEDLTDESSPYCASLRACVGGVVTAVMGDVLRLESCIDHLAKLRDVSLFHGSTKRGWNISWLLERQMSTSMSPLTLLMMRKITYVDDAVDCGSITWGGSFYDISLLDGGARQPVGGNNTVAS